MPFVPKDWSDSPSTATPITAAELERIEAGVQSATALAEGAAPASHTHAAGDVTSGTFAVSRLPQANTTDRGAVELATTAETTTGTDTVRAVTPAGVAAAIAAIPAPTVRYSAVNAQTGTTYAPVLADEGKLVTLSNAAAVTVTMPSDATQAFPVGASVDFAVIGAGMVTFVAGSGATVNATPSAVTRAQYSAVTAIKRAANTWLLVGDLA